MSAILVGVSSHERAVTTAGCELGLPAPAAAAATDGGATKKTGRGAWKEQASKRLCNGRATRSLVQCRVYGVPIPPRRGVATCGDLWGTFCGNDRYCGCIAPGLVRGSEGGTRFPLD